MAPHSGAEVRDQDSLWSEVEPLTRLPAPRRYPGAASRSRTACRSMGLAVLRSGIAWEDLPQKYGYGSGGDAWRAPARDRQNAGVSGGLHH